jgi:hypothetical protein
MIPDPSTLLTPVLKYSLTRTALESHVNILALTTAGLRRDSRTVSLQPSLVIEVFTKIGSHFYVYLSMFPSVFLC